MSKFDMGVTYIQSDIGKNKLDKEIKKLEEKDNSFAGIEIQVNREDKEIILSIFLEDGENDIFEGQSICIQEDLFDIRIGIELAYARAKIKKLEKINVDSKSISVLKEQCEEMEKVIYDINNILEYYKEG